MTKIYLSLLAVVFACVASAADSDAGSGADRRIREALLRLEGGEREGADAAAKLRAEPRLRVIAVLKDELASTSEPRSSVLRAVAVIEAHELWPELKSLASRADSWQVFSTSNRLLASETDAEKRREMILIYLSRLGSLPAAAKQAVLDGLAAEKTVITRDAFQNALEDSVFQVRISAVRQFLASRSAMAVDEQVARFQAAFAVKPYQARLAAMKGFLKIERLERAKLKVAIRKDLCAGETNDDVKPVCRDLVRELGAKP